jgi:CubicO group peptidase (beta-lactamase class C family)
MRAKFIGLLSAIAFVAAPAAWARSLGSGKPEDIGMSPERLAKVGEVFKKEIQDGKIPGAVIIIARNGKVAYHEAFGYQNSFSVRLTADLLAYLAERLAEYILGNMGPKIGSLRL